MESKEYFEKIMQDYNRTVMVVVCASLVKGNPSSDIVNSSSN